MRAYVLVVAVSCGAPRPAEPTRIDNRAEPRPGPCRLLGTWAPDQPHQLRLRAGGVPFATVFKSTGAVLSLAGATAAVELSLGDLDLHGFVPLDALILHPAGPVVVAGFAAPGPTAVLRWKTGDAEQATFELALPSFVRDAAPVPTTGRCSELALDPATFDPRTAIETPAGTEAELVPEKRIALSAGIGEAPVARMSFAEGDGPRVEVIEHRGDQARIIILVDSLDPADDVVLVGWVDATALQPRSHGFGGSWGGAGERNGRPGRPDPDSRRVRCAHPVTLSAELGGDRAEVGTIAKDVEIDVRPGSDPAAPTVMIPSVRIELEPDARFVVAPSALADCTDLAP